MIYRSYMPAAPLSEFIERIWQCSDVPSVQPVRILPTGALELVINLSEDALRTYDSLEADRSEHYAGAVVAGAYKECLLIDPMHRAAIMGVHFKPGGAFPFLGAPADELTGMHVGLDALWGSAAADLRERLCAASFDGRFSLLEVMLAERLRTRTERHRAVPAALRLFTQSGGSTRVRDVARSIGLSQRQFIQVFASEVGLTPKVFCRVLRFQKARSLLHDGNARDWADLAVDCGYFDQSHLIHDFQAFAGLTPANYLRQSSRYVSPLAVR